MIINTKTAPQDRSKINKYPTFRVHKAGITFNKNAARLLGFKPEDDSFKLSFDVVGKRGKMKLDPAEGFRVSFKKPRTFVIYGSNIIKAFASGVGLEAGAYIFQIGEFKEGGWDITLVNVKSLTK